MLSIRPGRPTDQAFILALTERLSGFAVPHWRTPAEICSADHRILMQALHHPTPEVSLLVAEEPPGVPLGFVLSTTRQDYFTGESHAHVEVLAVEVSAEGRGVARRLMAAAESWAAERGYRRITLNVFPANERARVLYDRLGYEPETVHYHKLLPVARPAITGSGEPAP
jgi:ribosomal protein S18 acetylase RimI-like enzyme